MYEDPTPTELLRTAERSVAAARDAEQPSVARVDLARALLEMADALQELEEIPPHPGSPLLARALACVVEVADEIGASPDLELDDVVLEALIHRSRLLVMLGRPDETAAVTAQIRARVGDEEQQVQRAAALHEEAVGHYKRAAEDGYAVLEAAAAIELLGAPYADVLPPPPDSVIPYLAAGIAMLAHMALGQGQQEVAIKLFNESLERFGGNPDAEVQVQMEYARAAIQSISEST